nr:hypothetical protein [uncultured bacterium]
MSQPRRHPSNRKTRRMKVTIHRLTRLTRNELENCAELEPDRDNISF